jgi:hypothetical protein
MMQTKSLDALAKQREARLALMNDKIMEQKYIEIHDQLEKLKIKEAELLEQQNVLNDSIAAYEDMHLQLDEQKKSQVSPAYTSMLAMRFMKDEHFRGRSVHDADAHAGAARAAARRNGHRHITPHEVPYTCNILRFMMPSFRHYSPSSPQSTQVPGK